MPDFKHFHSVKNTFSLTQSENLPNLSIIKYNGLSSLERSHLRTITLPKLAQPIEAGDKNFFWASQAYK